MFVATRPCAGRPVPRQARWIRHFAVVDFPVPGSPAISTFGFVTTPARYASNGSYANPPPPVLCCLRPGCEEQSPSALNSADTTERNAGMLRSRPAPLHRWSSWLSVPALRRPGGRRRCLGQAQRKLLSGLGCWVEVKRGTRAEGIGPLASHRPRVGRQGVETHPPPGSAVAARSW